jgi:hypothetical protein
MKRVHRLSANVRGSIPRSTLVISALTEGDAAHTFRAVIEEPEHRSRQSIQPVHLHSPPQVQPEHPKKRVKFKPNVIIVVNGEMGKTLFSRPVKKPISRR